MKIGNIDELTPGRVKKFCKKVFEVMNGRINPIFPARKMKLIKSPNVSIIDQNDRHTVTMAYQSGDSVFFAYEEIYYFLKRNINSFGNNEPSIKGFILCLISHELGHMDQQFSSTGYEDYPARGSMESEVANDNFILNYIERYYDVIKDKIGAFNNDLYIETSAYLSEPNVDISKCKYSKITSIRDIAIAMLCSVFQFDFTELVEDKDYDNIKVIKIISVKNNRKYKNVMAFNIYHIFFEAICDKSIENMKDLIAFITDEFLCGYMADIYFDLNVYENNEYELVIYVNPYSKKFNTFDGDSKSFKVDTIYRKHNSNKDIEKYIDTMIDKYTIGLYKIE